MSNDAVRRLREPGAWVLIGAAVLQLLTGLIALFTDSRLPFGYRAYQVVLGDRFLGFAVVGVVVVAVLLAVRLGGGPTRQARTIALAGLCTLGALALFEVICVLAGLTAGGDRMGIVIDVHLAAKIGMLLYGLAKLAVLAVGAYWTLTVVQSSGPARPPQPQYPGQAYGPQGRPYGPVGAPQPQPGQPGYSGQPGQPGAPYAPPQGYSSYRGPQQPQYMPQGYPSPYPQQYQPQQPAPQPPAQPAQPPVSSPSFSAQPERQERSEQYERPEEREPRDEGAGEWTRAYGPGEVPLGEPEQRAGKPDQSPPDDPYRPPD